MHINKRKISRPDGLGPPYKRQAASPPSQSPHPNHPPPPPPPVFFPPASFISLLDLPIVYQKRAKRRAVAEFESGRAVRGPFENA